MWALSPQALCNVRHSPRTWLWTCISSRGPTTQAQLESGRSQAQVCPPGIHGPVGCRTQVSPVVSVAGRRNSHSSGRSKKSMLCFHRTKALGGSRLGGYSFRNKRMGDLSQSFTTGRRRAEEGALTECLLQSGTALGTCSELPLSSLHCDPVNCVKLAALYW